MVSASKKMPSKNQENILFFKRLLKNPKALGAVVPSSVALAQMIAQNVILTEDGYVLEVGAGTGRFTSSLLEAGIPADRLFVIELDRELSHYLTQKFPYVTVINGDASKLDSLLPPHICSKIDTIISGIPLINLNKQEILGLVASFRDVMQPKGHILQFTYGPLSPLPHRKLGLKAKRVGSILMNMPPATVWSYVIDDKPLVHKAKRGELIKKAFSDVQKKAIHHLRRDVKLKRKNPDA
jgi:phosphatidylethanolamine/phosphatidyl-N-methylethanolamine N-methyltransferase